MSYSDEVEECFRLNPDLVNLSPKKLGEWFYVQGILYQSNVVEGVSNKFIHFVKHMNPEQHAKAKKSWDKVNNLGETECLSQVKS